MYTYYTYGVLPVTGGCVGRGVGRGGRGVGRGGRGDGRGGATLS